MGSFCGAMYDSFVSEQRGLVQGLVLQRRKDYESHYIACNNANRLEQSEQGSSVSAVKKPAEGSIGEGGRNQRWRKEPNNLVAQVQKIGVRCPVARAQKVKVPNLVAQKKRKIRMMTILM